MCPGSPRHVALGVLLTCVLFVSACSSSGMLKQQYEYEEETLPVAGRFGDAQCQRLGAGAGGAARRRADDRPVAPGSTASKVRAFFEGPGVDVTRVSLSRRDGRRFVHVSLDVDDIRQLPRVAPFAWSRYRLQRQADVVEFSQVVGAAAARPVERRHLARRRAGRLPRPRPEPIPFHNSREAVQRGNILAWEQPLSDRLAGAPLRLEVHMEPESILYTTLMLFGATVAAAALTFAVIIWWVVRRGRRAELAESR